MFNAHNYSEYFELWNQISSPTGYIPLPGCQRVRLLNLGTDDIHPGYFCVYAYQNGQVGVAAIPPIQKIGIEAVAGVALEHIAPGRYGDVCTQGPVAVRVIAWNTRHPGAQAVAMAAPQDYPDVPPGAAREWSDPVPRHTIVGRILAGIASPPNQPEVVLALLQ